MSLHRTEVEPIPKIRRPWICKWDQPTCSRVDPCKHCKGARVRRGGMTKQRAAFKRLLSLLGGMRSRFHGRDGHEENWTLPLRCEVKSGAQVGPIATRFLAAEKQSDQNKALGDPRGFCMVAMPKDWGSDGLLIIRLSTAEAME